MSKGPYRESLERKIEVVNVILLNWEKTPTEIANKIKEELGQEVSVESVKNFIKKYRERVAEITYTDEDKAKVVTETMMDSVAEMKKMFVDIISTLKSKHDEWSENPKMIGAYLTSVSKLTVMVELWMRKLGELEERISVRKEILEEHIETKKSVFEIISDMNPRVTEHEIIIENPEPELVEAIKRGQSKKSEKKAAESQPAT